MLKGKEEDKNRSGIYKIINLINQKIYIGRSNNIFARINSHGIAYKKGKVPLYNAIRKYGKENFTYDVIEYCAPEKTIEQEVYWINFFNPSNNLIGYNCDIVETGTLYKSKETREKLSNSLKGNQNGKGQIPSPERIALTIKLNKERVWTDEQRNKLRIANLGKKHSEETRLKRNKAITGVKKNLTNEARKILSERIKNSIKNQKGINHPNIITIDKFDLNNNFIENYFSINEACSKTGLTINQMRRQLYRYKKSIDGFRYLRNDKIYRKC